jgi:hypothetical protein
LIASDNIVVFDKDNKSVTPGDAIRHKQLFFWGFSPDQAVALSLRFTISSSIDWPGFRKGCELGLSFAIAVNP